MHRSDFLKAVHVCALSVLCVLAPPTALAQDYPSKPISFVVGYPPGGGADVLGRLIAKKMAEAMGAVTVVDNRPGFSGNLGAQHAARSVPDGYTLLVAPWTTYAINSYLFPTKVGYALDKDFAPVSVIGYQPMALMVTPSLPVNSVAELIALAKAKPDSLSFGSTGNGSLEQISAEMFMRVANINMVHIPYKGSGPAVTDLMSGQIQVYFATAPTLVSNLNSGRIRPLMVTSPERNPAFPDLPTPKESGLGGYEVRSTYGLLAPAGTPAPIIKRLNDEMAKILRAPDVVATFRSFGVDPTWSTPADLGKFIRADMAKWAQIMKDANIKPE